MPTSRATRVTSEVNTDSWSIIVLTSLAERRNSPSSGRPSTSSAIVCPRSPLATAPTARVTSVVGRTRSSISSLMAATSSAQPPITPTRPVLPCPPCRPAWVTRGEVLPRPPLAEQRNVVERVGNLSIHSRGARGQTDGEIALLERQHGRDPSSRCSSKAISPCGCRPPSRA